MSRSRLTQSSRLVARSIRGSNASRSVFRQTLAKPSSVLKSNFLSKSPFSTCVIRPKGAESTSAASPVTATPTELTDNEYHDLADAWLENALVRFEDIQDQSDEVDVEFSSGVMTIRIPEKGTYVLNKQPPNKQIWLSSPLSGPKRYDWCASGDGQGEGGGTPAGQWVYSRDGSTLDQLIHEEIGVDLQEPFDG